MTELSNNPKAFLNGMYVTFPLPAFGKGGVRKNKRATGYVSEVFDDGFAVDMINKTHDTEYTIFVKTEDVSA